MLILSCIVKKPSHQKGSRKYGVRMQEYGLYMIPMSSHGHFILRLLAGNFTPMQYEMLNSSNLGDILLGQTV